MIYKVKLSDYGNSLGPRVLGIELFNKISNRLDTETNLIVEIDLNGLSNLSSAFSYELFGKLYVKYQPNFGARIKLKFGEHHEDADRIKKIVKLAIIQSIQIFKSEKI